MRRNRTLLAMMGIVASLAVMLVLPGCGGPTEKTIPTAKVSGTITYQGKPLAGGKVIFLNVAGPSAVSDIKAGKYQLMAAIGENQISIEHREASPPPPDGRPMLVMPGKSLVPEKYASGMTSGLKYTVNKGDQTHDITLAD